MSKTNDQLIISKRSVKNDDFNVLIFPSEAIIFRYDFHPCGYQPRHEDLLQRLVILCGDDHLGRVFGEQKWIRPTQMLHCNMAIFHIFSYCNW